MTKGERLNKIMQEERATTTKRMDSLPPEVAADAPQLWLAIQEAVNQWIGEQDRVVDGRLVPAVLRLTIDELERVQKRLNDAGLSLPPG